MIYRNIPNILSMIRIFLSPLIFFFILKNTPFFLLCSLLIFIFGALTDALDGYIARTYNLISSLGKFLDPLSDKLFVLSTFVALSYINDSIYMWMIVVIVMRDLFVTLLRLYANNQNIKFETSYFAKIKTFFQMSSIFMIIVVLLANMNIDSIDVVYSISLLCTLVTLLSGIDYLINFLSEIKNG